MRCRQLRSAGGSLHSQICRRQGISFWAIRKLRATGGGGPWSHDLYLTVPLLFKVLRLRLEAQLQSQLNDARVAIGVGNLSERCIGETRVRILEQRMIEDVEELRTELEVSAIPDFVDWKILEEREIEVKLTGPSQYAHSSVAEARCHGWAVSVGERNAVRSGRIERFFIAYDWG
jgi:hypothetical protein